MPNAQNAGHSSAISGLQLSRRVGRICGVSAEIVTVEGLESAVSVGDRVAFLPPTYGPLSGEVLFLKEGVVGVLPDGSTEGMAIGDAVKNIGKPRIAPHASWLGRVIDANCCPMDGRPLTKGDSLVPLKAAAPMAARRRGLGERLETGIAVFNTMLPLVRGQRLGLFAGSGVGKSSLLAQFARGVSADVVVIALIGERGREVGEFVRNVLGPQGMARAVVVAATSDRPAAERRRCAWAAMSVAEFFRDQGKNVLFLADSITRFAEAHREMAFAAGEGGQLEGYPPSTAQTLMSLSERAGPGGDGQGDITAVFSVLVPGSDMDGPVADILRGVLDGHVVLSREIAERGRYPAIDLLRSVSRSLPHAASEAENALIARARRLLGVYDRAEVMIQAGLYTAGTDPDIDAAIRVWAALDQFLAETEPKNTANSFDRLSACLAQAGPVGRAAGKAA